MTLKCECGGELLPALLKDYDFSSLAGYPVRLQEIDGLRCATCGAETLNGREVEAALRAVALELTRSKELLTSRAARYLRKFLQLTQEELAHKMAVARETVAAWECGQRPISQRSDLFLRALVAIAVARQTRLAPDELPSQVTGRRIRPKPLSLARIGVLEGMVRTDSGVGGHTIGTAKNSGTVPDEIEGRYDPGGGLPTINRAVTTKTSLGNVGAMVRQWQPDVAYA